MLLNSNMVTPDPIIPDYANLHIGDKARTGTYVTGQQLGGLYLGGPEHSYSHSKFFLQDEHYFCLGKKYKKTPLHCIFSERKN